MAFRDELLAPVKSPQSLAHVVFRTANYQAMVDFYTAFLGAEITHQNGVAAFLRYDHEHHRIAILARPGTTERPATAAGLDHIAFTYGSLADLVMSYRQRKARGMVPIYCRNHGPTTSMYYVDPDGNKIETQIDNFDKVEDAVAFMSSTSFVENPIGVDFEPEELMQRLEAGETDAMIKKRGEIGHRALPA